MSLLFHSVSKSTLSPTHPHHLLRIIPQHNLPRPAHVPLTNQLPLQVNRPFTLRLRIAEEHQLLTHAGSLPAGIDAVRKSTAFSASCAAFTTSIAEPSRMDRSQPATYAAAFSSVSACWRCCGRLNGKRSMASVGAETDGLPVCHLNMWFV